MPHNTILHAFHKFAYCLFHIRSVRPAFKKIPRLLDRDGDPHPPCLPGRQKVAAWQRLGANHETLCPHKSVHTSTYKYIPVHTSKYWYVLENTSTYQYIVHTSTYQYILVCTSTYQYIQVYTGMYQYILVHHCLWQPYYVDAMTWYKAIHTNPCPKPIENVALSAK